MEDLKQLLIDGDPVAREPGLDAIDAQAIRRRTVTEVRAQPAPPPLLWRLSPLALAAAIAASLVLAVGIGTRLKIGDAPTTVVAPAVKENARRQMQFETPGGTRVIWTFQDEMEL